MRLFIKTVVVLLGIVVLLFVAKSYKMYVDTQEQIAYQSFNSAKSIAYLTTTYRKASIDANKEDSSFANKDSEPYVVSTEQESVDIFKNFYEFKNENFAIGIIKLNKKSSIINKNIKGALSFFQANKDEKYYFTSLSENRYFFAAPISSKTDTISTYSSDVDSLVLVTIDAREIKAVSTKNFIDDLLFNYILALIGLVLVYLLIRNYNSQKNSKLNTLNDKLNKYSDIIKKDEEKIKHIRTYDTLTNLPNRNMLIQDLKDQDKCVTIILINIDNFKELNEFYGLDIGDKVLVSFASFLKIYADKNGFELYKLHADEYAVLWKSIDKDLIMEQVAQIISNIQHFSVTTENDNIVEIEATLGIAIGKECILSNADMALKRAKKRQLPYLIYEDKLKISNEYQHNIHWARKIRHALKYDKIITYAQPIMDAKDGKISRYEVLVRLVDENDKIVLPYVFLDVAKKNKLYSFITREVIVKSFQKFADTTYEFSINVSILDMENQDTMTFILMQLQKFPHPQNITFEIQESEGMENYELVKEFIQKIKAFGCKIAIDDFGSGYSNFEYLLNLDVDMIKFDASLIKDIDADKNSQIVVQTISNYAKKLNIHTCAEYVHNDLVYEQLMQMDVVEFMQGFHISEPLPFEDIV